MHIYASTQGFFDHGSEFKLYFNPLLNYFNIETVLTTVKTRKLKIW